MGNLKSQTQGRADLIGFCLGLTTTLLQEVLQQAGCDPTRDVETITRRTSAEGLGLLTKTLPAFGKAVQAALCGERLTIPLFRKIKGTAIPHFLKALLSRIFTADGLVRDDAEICAITDVLQICFLFYKLEVPYDLSTEARTLDKFENTDKGLPSDFTHLDRPSNRVEPIVLEVAADLITELMEGFDPVDIVPRHGPGAVATGEGPEEKMQFKRIYSNVEKVYPAAGYYYLNKEHFLASTERHAQMWRILEPTAKVVLVPKDSRGPRLISCEPLEVQYVQQGLGRKLVKWVERHRLTSGHVNFTDQMINRKLALEGSANGQWSTLDLSDASDRVSLALVKRLFGKTGILPYLLNTRSTSTLLPNGGVVRLRKFAPMGSALCFPVEALCFWALSVALIHVIAGKRLRYALNSVYVYGDDIIVRDGLEKPIFDYFHYFGLRLNLKKCCTSAGSFRESCGCDAYRGNVVTPIKVKTTPPTQNTRKSGSCYASYVELSNQLYQRGYYLCAGYVKKRVEEVFGEVPYSGRSPHRIYQTDKFGNFLPWGALSFVDSAPAWYTRIPPRNEDLHSKRRYNSRFQRREYYVATVEPTSFDLSRGATDWSELFRHLLSNCGTQAYRYAHRRRTQLKRRWVGLDY